MFYFQVFIFYISWTKTSRSSQVWACDMLMYNTQLRHYASTYGQHDISFPSSQHPYWHILMVEPIVHLSDPEQTAAGKKNTMQWRSAIGQVSGLTYLELSMIVYNSYYPRFNTGKKDIWIFKNIEKGHNSVTLWTGPHIKSWHVRQYTKGIIISWIHDFY